MNASKVFLFSIMLFVATALWAQPKMPDLGFKTGVLRGTLVTLEGGKKKVVPEQAVAMMVFQDGQRVLMLDKKTDANGIFEFKNIFRDPSFKYTLGVMQNDHLYLLNDLQMKENQEEMTVEFEVGPESKNLVPDSVVAQMQQNEQNTQPPEGMGAGSMSMGNASAPKTANHELLGPSKKVALVLSALVIIYAFYFALRKQKGV